MIVIDANYFLRYLVQPTTPQDEEMSKRAAALFGMVRAGIETATTTDAVIAEVVFILSAKRHYGVERGDVVARLKPILQLTGLRLPRKRSCLSAFDLWVQTPTISFVDALAAQLAIDLQTELATFDAAPGRVPGVATWEPRIERT
jgi:predicted nucleic acid-binding protein